MENIEILLLFIIITTVLLSITNNYMVFLRNYVIQVFLIMVIFFLMYSWSFHEEFVLIISFVGAIFIRLILIPNYIKHFISEYYLKKSRMRMAERIPQFSNFYIFIILIFFLFFISYLSIKTFWNYNSIFITSIFILFAWLLNFINHKRLVWDILSFLEIENAVFLFSLLIIKNVPIYIELWILIDVVMSLMILLILVFKIKEIVWTTNVESLTELKD